MKILAVDTTAKAASVAVLEDGKILSSGYTNTGLTHSQTLMPMIDNTLKGAELSIGDIDFFAVNTGPGSFTGVRIGVACIKGMAQALGKKCIPVSALESLAYNLIDTDCVAVCAMDARCSQVYTASFNIEKGKITRLCEDRACLIEELFEEIRDCTSQIVFVGDGAKLCYDYYKEKIPCRIAGEMLRYENAVSTAVCAYMNNGFQGTDSRELMPMYLRLPQAQRELSKRLSNQQLN